MQIAYETGRLLKLSHEISPSRSPCGGIARTSAFPIHGWKFQRINRTLGHFYVCSTRCWPDLCSPFHHHHQTSSKCKTERIMIEGHHKIVFCYPYYHKQKWRNQQQHNTINFSSFFFFFYFQLVHILVISKHVHLYNSDPMLQMLIF